jgi:diguanylate cyclase (GGDEF)-like protein
VTQDPFAVFMLDLDRFKSINDTLGHPTGDQLLKEVAQRLKSSLQKTDVLARLGGDEFAIIQVGEKEARDGAARLAARILDLISQPFEIDGAVLSVSASLGMATAPDDARDSTALLKMADLALYQTKFDGRNGYSFFEAAMQVSADSRQNLEAALRTALSRDEFELHYQPEIDVKT